MLLIQRWWYIGIIELDYEKANSYLPTSVFSSGSLFRGSSVEYSSYERHSISTPSTIKRLMSALAYFNGLRHVGWIIDLFLHVLFREDRVMSQREDRVQELEERSLLNEGTSLYDVAAANAIRSTSFLPHLMSLVHECDW